MLFFFFLLPSFPSSGCPVFLLFCYLVILRLLFSRTPQHGISRGQAVDAIDETTHLDVDVDILSLSPGREGKAKHMKGKKRTGFIISLKPKL